MHCLFKVTLSYQFVAFLLELLCLQVIFLLSFLPFLQVRFQCHEIRIIFRDYRLLLCLLLRIRDKILPLRVIIAIIVLPKTLLGFFPHVPSMFSFLTVFLFIFVDTDHYLKLLLPLFKGHGFLLAF